MSTMGIDIGTTGCKALVFDAGGNRLSSAYREYPLLSPHPGWAELDSKQVIDACLDVIREAAAASGDPVRAIGISSQGEAFTAVGPDGSYLYNAMVSSDTRAADIAETWSKDFGRKRLYRATGHTAHPLFTLFKIVWLRDNLPDVWDRAAKFYCFEELLQSRLGLDPAISWPLAGRTMMFNVRTHKWDPQILEKIGLDAAKLARPVPSGTIVGTIPAAMADRLGLGHDVAVVAGGHDQPAAAFGAGAVSPGQALYAMGTVECICPAFPMRIFSQDLFQNNLCIYDHVSKGLSTSVAYSLTGGNLLKWFRDEWSAAERDEAARTGANVYELILRELPPNPTDLLVLPYFTPSGTPYFSIDVPGAILGLRLSTTRGEVLRGLIEGVCLEMRLNLDILDRTGLKTDEFRAAGGGSKSRALNQIKADVLGRPLTTVEEPEAGCLGMAMLAYAAIENGDPAELSQTWVKTGETVEPNANVAAQYTEKFEQYVRLYPTLCTFVKGDKS